MQALDESRIEGLKEIWEGYIRLESKLTTDAQAHLDSMMRSVQAIDASVDSAIFVRTHRAPWSAPQDQPFESSPTFNDTVCFNQVPLFFLELLRVRGNME